jgi:hypothetical protein
MSTTALFVARGRTVVAGDKVMHGPGDLVTLPADEARRLTAMGFVAATPPVLLDAAPSLNPAGIGQRDAGQVQGPTYNR